MARWIGRPRIRHVLSRRFCRERIVRSGFNGGVRVGHGLTTSTVTGAPDSIDPNLLPDMERRVHAAGAWLDWLLPPKGDVPASRVSRLFLFLFGGLTLLEFGDEVTVFGGLLPA